MPAPRSSPHPARPLHPPHPIHPPSPRHAAVASCLHASPPLSHWRSSPCPRPRHPPHPRSGLMSDYLGLFDAAGKLSSLRDAEFVGMLQLMGRMGAVSAVPPCLLAWELWGHAAAGGARGAGEEGGGWPACLPAAAPGSHHRRQPTFAPARHRPRTPTPTSTSTTHCVCTRGPPPADLLPGAEGAGGGGLLPLLPRHGADHAAAGAGAADGRRRSAAAGAGRRDAGLRAWLAGPAHRPPRSAPWRSAAATPPPFHSLHPPPHPEPKHMHPLFLAFISCCLSSPTWY